MGMFKIGLWQYVTETSLQNLSYPLDIDMKDLLHKLTNNISTGVEPINPHPFAYITFPKKSCQKANILLLMLVKSAANHISHRNIIRKSWGFENYYTGNERVRTVFMLGQTDDLSLKRMIRGEVDLYGDIVQEDFLDAYENNTKKMVMSFNWAAKYCEGAKFVLFIDDDYYVNVDNLLNYLKDIPLKRYSSLFTGFMFNNSKPFRYSFSKWYVSTSVYPSSRWPPYITAGAILVSMELVTKLTYVFPFVESIFMDDIFLGIVAWKLGITFQHDERFRFYRKYPYDAKMTSKLFASHEYSDHEEMFTVWMEHKMPYLQKLVKDITHNR